MKRILLFILLQSLLLPIFGQKTISVKQEGTLRQQLTAAEVDTCSHLIIKGPLNSEDFKLLRYMAGGNEEGKGALCTLNLSGAEIQRDNKPFLVLDARKEELVVACQPTERDGRSAPMDIYYDEVNRSHATRKRYYKAYNIKPFYVLNYPFVEITIQRKGKLEPSPTRYGATAVIRMENGASEEEWAYITGTKVNKFKAHELVKDGDRFLFRIALEKDCFSQETFYQCPKIEKVILSRKTKLRTEVLDMGSKVVFYKGKKMVNWNKNRMYTSVNPFTCILTLKEDGTKYVRYSSGEIEKYDPGKHDWIKKTVKIVQ